MANSFETRVRTAVLALVVFSVLVSTIRLFAGTLHLVRAPFVDDVARYEQRFAPLKSVLPERTIVGFLTDSKSPNVIEIRQRAVSYALSPLIIDWQSDWPLVIGDIADLKGMARYIPASLRVRHDFGDGVLLLERVE